MRGWGFTKKLEPIVWLSDLLGRGSLWAPNLIGALPRRREGKGSELPKLSRTETRDGERGRAPGPLLSPPPPQRMRRARTLCLFWSQLCPAFLSPQLLRPLPATYTL